VITGAFFGLAAIPAFLFVAFDLRTQLPQLKKAGIMVARRASETKALMDDPILIELTLENHGQGMERLLLQDIPPAQAEVTRGSTSLLCGVKQGGRVTLRYEVRFSEPGEYRFEFCSVRLKSMFGLAEQRLALPSPLTVRVYPRHLVKRLALEPAKAFGWSGITPSRFKGGRLDFVNIRGYTSGDPLKDVNWKASGRVGKMLVNEWRAERGLDCVVAVDLSSESLSRVGEWSARTDVITAAYELISSLVGSGNRVGMLVMGRLLRKIEPGFGTKHLHIMVESLVDAQEGMVWSLKYTERFLEMFFRKQYRTRGGTLFFIFAWPSEELFETVTSLSRKGFVCNSVMVDAFSEEERALTEQKILKAGEAQSGLRFAQAERDYLWLMLAPVSNLYVWRAGEGFTEARRRTRG
jgi:uncharacterized protein (DUF58 family)